MTIGKRIKISLLSAVLAVFFGSMIVFVLDEAVRTTAFIGIIMAALLFGITLVAAFLLEGRPSRLRIPVFALIMVLAVVSVCSYTLYTVGKRSCFPGSHDEDAYEELCDAEGVIEINEGSLSGWMIPASNVPEGEPRPVILYFAGNGENSSHKVEFILDSEKSAYLHEDYDFVFLDYPSYGHNETPLTESSLYQFTLDAYNYVTSLETTSGVTLLSYSIGNGPAMYLASQEDVELDGMIMLAPYNSGYDLYNSNFNIFYGPLRLLVAFKLPAFRYARSVSCPVTMIASTDDEVIPYESSRELFSALSGSSANFITVEGVLHNDFFSSPETIDAIMNSLEVS